jgi:curved DNA-binding protein CbpA
MQRKSAHELLGFNPTVNPSKETILENFKKQQLILHPDKNRDRKTEADFLFICLNKAFDRLH